MNTPKQCRKCQAAKPRDQFYPHPSTADRLENYCKECRNQYRKDLEAANKDRERARRNTYRGTPAVMEQRREYQRLYRLRKRAAGQRLDLMSMIPRK